MVIFLVCSTSGITSGKKFVAQNDGNFENFEISIQLQFHLRYEKIVPNYAKESIFHDDDVIDDVTGWPQSRPSIFLYKLNNSIFHDNKKRAKISSLNFLCIGIMKLQLHLYKCVIMTSLMMSQGHKVGQILKLISPSIIELERRSKAQNVGNGDGYLSDIFIFRYNCW